jgi:hypothetical protein
VDVVVVVVVVVVKLNVVPFKRSRYNSIGKLVALLLLLIIECDPSLGVKLIQMYGM